MNLGLRLRKILFQNSIHLLIIYFLFLFFCESCSQLRLIRLPARVTFSVLLFSLCKLRSHAAVFFSSIFFFLQFSTTRENVPAVFLTRVRTCAIILSTKAWHRCIQLSAHLPMTVIPHHTTSPVFCDADYILMLNGVIEYNRDSL